MWCGVLGLGGQEQLQSQDMAYAFVCGDGQGKMKRARGGLGDLMAVWGGRGLGVLGMAGSVLLRQEKSNGGGIKGDEGGVERETLAPVTYIALYQVSSDGPAIVSQLASGRQRLESKMP